MSDKRLTIMLERANPLVKPEYSVVGHTWCAKCKHKVWLGAETMATLRRTDVEVWPMCMDCGYAIAREHPDVFTDANMVDHIEDPEVCPKCGKKHPPTVDPMDN